MKRIEALSDAIMRYSGYNDPASAACRNRNPGLLRAFSPHQRRDEEGYRIFSSLIDGYRALLFDLVLKCSGKSNSRLSNTSTLRDLMIAYRFPPNMASPVCNFLRHIAGNEELDERTSLRHFVEDQPNG